MMPTLPSDFVGPLEEIANKQTPKKVVPMPQKTPSMEATIPIGTRARVYYGCGAKDFVGVGITMGRQEGSERYAVRTLCQDGRWLSFVCRLNPPDAQMTEYWFEVDPADIELATLRVAMREMLQFLSKKEPTEADRQRVIDVCVGVFDGDDNALQAYAAMTGRKISQEEEE